MKFNEIKKSADNKHDRLAALQSRGSNLEMILNIVKKINGTLILNEVLELVVKSAIEITGAERGVVLLNSDNSLKFKLGLNAKGELLKEENVTISTSVIEEVYKSGESVFLESAKNDSFGSKSIQLLELETILCSPCIVQGKAIGVIYVDSRSLKSINQQIITDTFEILAGQAAIAIRNAQLFQGQKKAVTELKVINTELEKAKALVERSDKIKTEFLSQISHEIRTPIHVLTSNLNLIRDELSVYFNEDLHQSFNSISVAGNRIIRTIDLIVNMSELQLGTYKVSKAEFYLGKDVLFPLYNEFVLYAKQKGIQFLMEYDTDDAKVVSDQYSVKQVFSNLIDNAIKYTSEGKVVIVLGKDENQKTKVEIRDSGIGIAKEYIPHLFDAFTQEEQGYSRSFEGSGLGLALVSKYCELNNLTIKVESEKGKGATFSVTFN